MVNATVPARIYLSLIGLLLAAAGGVFTWLMSESYQQAKAISDWPEVDAIVLRSEVVPRRVDPQLPPEYQFQVWYAYEWEGSNYESDRYQTRDAPWTKDRSRAEAFAARYKTGELYPVKVNPDDPSQAVLAGESKAAIYSIWFPLIFVVGGLGMVVGAWRPRKKA